MSEPEEDTGFLSRWSRRKLAAKETAPGEAKADEALQTPEPPHAPEADAEARAARDAELAANREAAEAVDLETLSEHSDFSVFMKDGVPAILRRRAMAALWRSSAVFANIDGLVDYGEDYTDPAFVPAALKSAWQVGRGYLKDDGAEKSDAPMLEDAAAADAGQETLEGEAPEQQELAHSEETGDRLSAEADPIAPAAPAESAPEEAEADPEPEPMPRVSLRRRLMLDGNG